MAIVSSDTTTTTTGTVARVVEKRDYLVFAPDDDETTIKWVVVGTYSTLTPEDALTQANATLPKDEQNVTMLVPVAARNWQPRTPKVEEPPPPKVVWT